MSKRVVIASDHAAVPERAALVSHLEQAGHQVEDLGYPEGASVDYPDPAREVAEAVQAGKADYGILLCGSGIGVAMAAGKVAGIRAATCCSEWMAEMARRHNDANVLCMGARIHAPAAMARMADVFLATGFDGGRHARRVAKIDARDDATA